MKLILLAILLSTGFWTRFTEVSKVNEWKKEAQQAFQKGNFKQAANIYQQLLSSASSDQSALQLNLAHCLRLSGNADAGASVYRQVARSTNPKLRSVAWQQLGNLAAKTDELEQALDFYRRALIANSHNETARFNYELVARLLKQDKNQQQPPPKPNQTGEQQESSEKENKGSEQNQPASDPSGEKGDEKAMNQGDEKGKEEGQKNNADKSDEQKKADENNRENADPEDQQMQTLRKRLEGLNMSPEQAKTLLDAMRDNEQQYLQQLPKPTKSSPLKGKPNW